MDVKTISSEELVNIVTLFINEQKKTSITKMDNQGRLACKDEQFRSPYSHHQSFLAWDELMKRPDYKEDKEMLTEYTRAKNRYDKWHGILCARIIEHIVRNNADILPAELVTAANK